MKKAIIEYIKKSGLNEARFLEIYMFIVLISTLLLVPIGIAFELYGLIIWQIIVTLIPLLQLAIEEIRERKDQ